MCSFQFIPAFPGNALPTYYRTHRPLLDHIRRVADFDSIVNIDLTIKMGPPMDHPVFNPGSLEEEFSFPDLLNINDIKPTSDLLGSDVVFGEEISLSLFPGLGSNDDVYLPANKESEMHIFLIVPVKVS
jgi:hypothetical protein